LSSTTRATMKHAAVYSAAAMAARLIGFIMLPFYAHVLRGHGYAVIGMLDVGLGFLLSLLVYGMQGSIIRLYHDEKDPARKPVVVSTGIILIGAVTAVVTIPLMVFSKPIAALLIDDAGLNHLVILALLAFNFDMVGQAASSWLLVRSRSAQMAGLSLLRLVLGLSLNIYLILIKGMGLDGYFISSLSVNVFSCVIFVGIALRDCGRGFDPEIARTIRSFLVPLMPGSIASWVGRQVERIMAKSLINLESVGILEMGYKFPVLISMMVITPFMRSWETRRFEIADQPGAPQTIAGMFTYYIFILCWVGVLLAVVIKPVLEMLTPPEFHLAYRIARVEIVTVILQGAYYHLLFGLAYAKDTKTISNLRTGTAAFKIVLSWFFISTWGIYGAAYSAAVTGVVTAILTFRYSQRHYRLPLQWGALAFVVGSAAMVFLLATRWDVTATTAYAWLDTQVLPAVSDGLGRTFLGSWKDGKYVQVLAERSGLLAEIALRGTTAACYAVLVPAIHPPTRTRFLTRLRQRRV
jgi:O-antigen/teichoic acid export membrane protein